MNKLVLVKFGGSLITDKTQEEKINNAAINKLARQLKNVLDNHKRISYLVGTGAGSFGHIQVKKYNLNEGIETEEQKLGLAIVEDSVARLNRMVVASLLKSGLPAISFNPSSYFTMSNGETEEIFLESLIGFLNLGIIPVTYGDMVYDIVRGATVLSTDKQFLALTAKLSEKNIAVDKVIFCGATKGVVDENGKTIDKINRDSYPSIESVFFENGYVDVTGGMKKKVQTALKIADFGIKSYIIDGDSLENCLTHNKFDGTLIE
jgi:isopentenyl phosphate kinase